MADWTMDDVSYTIDGGRGLHIYDGWIIAVLNDGRIINRFEGMPGWERVAAKAGAIIAAMEVARDDARGRG